MNANFEEKSLLPISGQMFAQRTQTLFEGDDILMTQEEKFSAEIIEFLDRAIWGTEETLFKHTDTKGRIADLLNPLFVVLRIKDQVAATVVMERRKLQHGDLKTDSYFVRYYASQVSFRNRRIVGLYSHKFIDFLRERDQEKSVYYASIEKKNHRSININTKMGYSPIAEIKTIGFSRFFPQRQPEVCPADDQDLVFVKNCLVKKYHDHSLFHS